MTVDERLEAGIPHDPRSEILARSLAKIDEQNGNLFDFKFGGDGDNGESLMYLLDIYFQEVLPK